MYSAVVAYALHFFNWSLLAIQDINPYSTVIDTSSSQTVNFEIVLTQGDVNPTGAGFRSAILINDSFIGPTLHLNLGDKVEFLVRNHLRQDTTIHFHGISQFNSPWVDGTPGIAQREIRPGASYLYKWEADEAGVYFYHAHNKGQIMDGLYGAIVIDAPAQEERPFHLISSDVEDQTAMRVAEGKLQPLFISDWSRFSSPDFWQIERDGGIDFTCMDSILVNGAGSQYCLDRSLLDQYTNPLVQAILKAIGEEGVTNKGCVPPLPLFQGNFTLRPDLLPQEAYNKCTPGIGGGGNYTVNVHSGAKWAALTFINPGGLFPLLVTIDNHPLHVYAIDGQYIYPQTVDQILVSNGARISVFVKLDQENGRYTIRIANQLLAQVLGGFAALSYNGVSEEPPHPRPMMNYAGQPLSSQLTRFSDTMGRPYPPLRPSLTADRTHKFLVKKLGQPHTAYEWTLSGHQGYNRSEESRSTPILYEDPAKIEPSDLLIKTNKGEWIDLIIEVEGPFAQAHPMHKHGSKAFVLGAGIGPFPWATVAEAAKVLPPATFNTVDPPYRDTFNTLEGVGNNTWMVLRYKADHPGAWLLHCHVSTHLSGGMAAILLDGVDDYAKVPREYSEWNGFEQPHVTSAE